MVRTMRKPAAAATAPADSGRRTGIVRTLPVIVLAASLGACSSLIFSPRKMTRPRMRRPTGFTTRDYTF